MATVHGQRPGIAEGPDGLLRLGCDPLHRQLLAAGQPVVTAWHPIECWCALLRQGALDAALVSVAGMAIATRTSATPMHGSSPQPEGCGVPEHWADPAQGSPEIRAISLGRRPLVLLHAHDQHTATDRHHSARRPWQLLLPPAGHQPLLWRQLQQLALLPQRDFSSADSEAWLQSLLQGPHLLPAHLSLLEAMPWLEAGLRAVPPPEPLEESLWLLVREGDQRHPKIQALAAQLQEALHRGMPSES